MPIEPHIASKLKPHTRLAPDYRLCGQTGVVYFYKASSSYNYEKDYFTKEYETQYGRTYLKDEKHLRELARRRLLRLSSYLQPGSLLLEIGSAFGFFLDEARKAGYQTEGIEVSQYAAAYAREKLKLTIRTDPFLGCQIPAQSLNAVCAFYVLEHIPEQKSVFAKIADSLKTGGLFCFALPSIHGPLFKRNPQEWQNAHPSDHFADYSPRSLKRILRLYNLRLIKAWPAAYHSERAGLLWSSALLAPLYRRYADFFCYGDTMEGLAIKTAMAG